MILLLILYFILLVVFSMMKRIPLSGKTLDLFRAFFPSWRFFEDIGEVPLLLYRVRQKGQNFGPWQPALEKATRHWSALFFNPHGNFLLAGNSLVQQLVSDIGHFEDLEASTSFQLTKNLVRYQISRDISLPGSLEIQFKITSGPPGTTQAKKDDLIVSPIYEA